MRKIVSEGGITKFIQSICIKVHLSCIGENLSLHFFVAALPQNQNKELHYNRTSFMLRLCRRDVCLTASVHAAKPYENTHLGKMRLGEMCIDTTWRHI